MNRQAGAAIDDLAETFLADYLDPEIDKRLFFDVWADRRGFSAELKRTLWRVVVRISRVRGARRSRKMRKQRQVTAAASRERGRSYSRAA